MMRVFVLIHLFLLQMYGQQIVQPVRLADCIAQALDRNPSIQISQAKVQGAEARSSEATTALLPQLKLSGRVAELNPIDAYTLTLPITPVPITKTLFPSVTENYSVRLSLQQPLFTGFKLAKNREIAELNANATREDMAKDQSEITLDVITAYWNLYRAIQAEEVIRQSVEQMSGHLKDVTNLLNQGMATDADVMKVKVQCSDVKVKHIEARNSIRISTIALNVLLGNSLEINLLPCDTPTVFRGLDSVLFDQNLQTLQRRAYQQRPDLKSMRLRHEMNRAGVTAAKSGWYPQVYLAANYDYARPNQRIIPPNDRWDGTWILASFSGIYGIGTQQAIRPRKRKRHCDKQKLESCNSTMLWRWAWPSNTIMRRLQKKKYM